MLKKALSVLIGCIIAICILELFLCFYNPFNNRIVNNNIVLPKNIVYNIVNNNIAKLPLHITHTKNNLGFRGPNISQKQTKPSVFCVGGSTTECFYLNDGTDWPSLVEKKYKNTYFINNAGLDGHSTFGHIVLLKNHIVKLKPNIVLFLIGCNDLATNSLNNYEKEMVPTKKRLLSYSQIFNTYQSIKRAKKAKNFGIHHQNLDFSKMPKVNQPKKVTLHKQALISYANRIAQLIQLTKQAGATPIFCTQPSMVLSTQPTDFNKLGLNGENWMQTAAKLNAFNITLLQTCNRLNVKCIDLAKTVPANPIYFYDLFHFTPQGAQQVATCIQF